MALDLLRWRMVRTRRLRNLTATKWILDHYGSVRPVVEISKAAGTIDSPATYDGSLMPSVRKASTLVHHGGMMDWWGSGGVTVGPTSVVTTPSR